MYSYIQEISQKKFELKKQKRIKDKILEINKLSYVLEELIEKDCSSVENINYNLF